MAVQVAPVCQPLHRTVDVLAGGQRQRPLDPVHLDTVELLFDRDLSLIEFYRRVFDEARDETNPLLERVKFLSIVGSIIDEFATTRYGELTRRAASRILTTGGFRAPDRLRQGYGLVSGRGDCNELRHGLAVASAKAEGERYVDLGDSPAAHLKRVEREIAKLLAEARRYLRDRLAPALAAEGIHLADYANLQPKERDEVEAYFCDSVLPLLMPLGFDAARPFPHVRSRDIALAVMVRDNPGKSERSERRGATKATKESRHPSLNNDQQLFACVQAPATIPALVPFHRRRRASLEQGFVWLDEVISEHLPEVFPGMEIVEVHPFRIFRDADIDTESPGRATLPDLIEEGVRQREFGEVLAIVVGERMPPRLVELLSQNLGLSPDAVQKSRDLKDLAKLADLSRLERPDLHDPRLAPHTLDDRAPALAPPHGPRVGDPALGPDGDIFASIRHGDILLHHPYESFQPAVELIERAAADPDVLAISTTLYRVGRHSPVVDALLKARRAGKQVRVVVELKARFDEETNLIWGRALEEAGAHVVYGAVGLKVHAKLTLVVRREAGALRRYVHLSSGNYNPVTSTIYTDLGLLTCSDGIASDATDLFNFLTGYASAPTFRKLLVAPMTLRGRVQQLIEREMAWAQHGQSGHIILKMNALVDKEIIQSLYRASQAGVRIDLIVRGICCLRPGVPGVSDNIRVVSIVGRFLEHSRAWYFRNGGHEEVYLGSADLMPRNLDRRVEVMVPVEEPRLRQRVRQEILAACLADNVKARELTRDGTYVRVSRRANEPAVNSQERLLDGGGA